MCAAALAQVPVAGLDWAGFARAPQWSTLSVEGRAVPSFGDDIGALVLSGEGVTQQVGNDPGQVVTVRFADLALVERYGDGGLVLYGRDGFRLRVEPTVHPLDPATTRWLDGALPEAVTIARPARAPDAIPRSTAPMVPAATASAGSGLPPPAPIGRVAWIGHLLLMALLGGFALGLGGYTVHAALTPRPQTAVVAVLGVMTLVLAVGALQVNWAYRRRSRAAPPGGRHVAGSGPG